MFFIRTPTHSRPALNKDIQKKIHRALSKTESFRLGLDTDNTLSRESFSQIMSSQTSDLHLTPRESALVFSNVDTDGSGKVTLDELLAYAEEHKDDTKEKKQGVLARASAGITEAQEESGYANKDDIAEQTDTIDERINGSGNSSETPACSFEMPSIPLADFPGLSLPDEVKELHFQLPSFVLEDFPGLEFIDSLTLGDLPQLNFPSIELGRFPGMEVIRFPASLSDNLQLPSFNIQDFPNVKLPTFEAPALPDTTLVTGLKIRAPKINMKLNIGGSLMKIKLFLGFSQCVSFFPVTFSSIKFPNAFLGMGKIWALVVVVVGGGGGIVVVVVALRSTLTPCCSFSGKFLEFFSVDLFSVFGSTACDLGTGFYPNFLFSFFLFPLVFGGAFLAYGAVRLRRKRNKGVVYTTESARTRLYTLLFMIVYSLYTGVATKMFVFFKCQPIQGKHYLVADYRVICYDEEYNQYQTLAVLGIVFYVFGLLGGILGLLFYNKSYLHASKCPDDMLYKHVLIQKQLGSVYGDCKWMSLLYHFWLVVD